MSHMLDEILAQAANGSPVTVTLSSESVAVLLFGSEFLGERNNWLDKGVDPLDEITDEQWAEIQKLVANAYADIVSD
jgi:D-alanine-D-alanine ligase-like ATP-grasp enzyme